MSSCKSSSCNFVYPILETECLGDSLSSINYNFNALDIETCNTELLINTSWNPAHTLFGSLSAKMNEIITIVSANSACWEETYTTVNTNSAFWLKPITIIYPFPVAAGANTNITTIGEWVNANFPPKSGNCFNFIVGQEIIVHVPEYATVNRSVVSKIFVPGYKYRIYLDIGPYNSIYMNNVAPNGWVGDQYVNATCHGTKRSVTASLDDQYIEKFVGVRFVLTANFLWENGTVIF